MSLPSPLDLRVKVIQHGINCPIHTIYDDAHSAETATTTLPAKRGGRIVTRAEEAAHRLTLPRHYVLFEEGFFSLRLESSVGIPLIAKLCIDGVMARSNFRLLPRGTHTIKDTKAQLGERAVPLRFEAGPLHHERISVVAGDEDDTNNDEERGGEREGARSATSSRSPSPATSFRPQTKRSEPCRWSRPSARSRSTSPTAVRQQQQQRSDGTCITPSDSPYGSVQRREEREGEGDEEPASSAATTPRGGGPSHAATANSNTHNRALRVSTINRSLAPFVGAFEVAFFEVKDTSQGKWEAVDRSRPLSIITLWYGCKRQISEAFPSIFGEGAEGGSAAGQQPLSSDNDEGNGAAGKKHFCQCAHFRPASPPIPGGVASFANTKAMKEAAMRQLEEGWVRSKTARSTNTNAGTNQPKSETIIGGGSNGTGNGNGGGGGGIEGCVGPARAPTAQHAANTRFSLLGVTGSTFCPSSSLTANAIAFAATGTVTASARKTDVRNTLNAMFVPPPSNSTATAGGGGGLASPSIPPVVVCATCGLPRGGEARRLKRKKKAPPCVKATRNPYLAAQRYDPHSLAGLGADGAAAVGGGEVGRGSRRPSPGKRVVSPTGGVVGTVPTAGSGNVAVVVSRTATPPSALPLTHRHHDHHHRDAFSPYFEAGRVKSRRPLTVHDKPYFPRGVAFASAAAPLPVSSPPTGAHKKKARSGSSGSRGAPTDRTASPSSASAAAVGAANRRRVSPQRRGAPQHPAEPKGYRDDAVRYGRPLWPMPESEQGLWRPDGSAPAATAAMRTYQRSTCSSRSRSRSPAGSRNPSRSPSPQRGDDTKTAKHAGAAVAGNNTHTKKERSPWRDVWRSTPVARSSSATPSGGGGGAPLPEEEEVIGHHHYDVDDESHPSHYYHHSGDEEEDVSLHVVMATAAASSSNTADAAGRDLAASSGGVTAPPSHHHHDHHQHRSQSRYESPPFDTSTAAAVAVTAGPAERDAEGSALAVPNACAATEVGGSGGAQHHDHHHHDLVGFAPYLLDSTQIPPNLLLHQRRGGAAAAAVVGNSAPVSPSHSLIQHSTATATINTPAAAGVGASVGGVPMMSGGSGTGGPSAALITTMTMRIAYLEATLAVAKEEASRARREARLWRGKYVALRSDMGLSSDEEAAAGMGMVNNNSLCLASSGFLTPVASVGRGGGDAAAPSPSTANCGGAAAKNSPYRQRLELLRAEEAAREAAMGQLNLNSNYGNIMGGGGSLGSGSVGAGGEGSVGPTHSGVSRGGARPTPPLAPIAPLQQHQQLQQSTASGGGGGGNGVVSPSHSFSSQYPPNTNSHNASLSASNTAGGGPPVMMHPHHFHHQHQTPSASFNNGGGGGGTLPLTPKDAALLDRSDALVSRYLVPAVAMGQQMRMSASSHHNDRNGGEEQFTELSPMTEDATTTSSSNANGTLTSNNRAAACVAAPVDSNVSNPASPENQPNAPITTAMVTRGVVAAATVGAPSTATAAMSRRAPLPTGSAASSSSSAVVVPPQADAASHASTTSASTSSTSVTTQQQQQHHHRQHIPPQYSHHHHDQHRHHSRTGSNGSPPASSSHHHPSLSRGDSCASAALAAARRLPRRGSLYEDDIVVVVHNDCGADAATPQPLLEMKNACANGGGRCGEGGEGSQGPPSPRNASPAAGGPFQQGPSIVATTQHQQSSSVPPAPYQVPTATATAGIVGRSGAATATRVSSSSLASAAAFLEPNDGWVPPPQRLPEPRRKALQ